MLKLAQPLCQRNHHRSYASSLTVKQHGEVVAEEIFWEGLREARLKEGDLSKLFGRDVRKVVIAEVIWQRTTVHLSWMREKLARCSPANASQQIRRLRVGKLSLKEVPNALREWSKESNHFSLRGFEVEIAERTNRGDFIARP